MSDSEDSCSMAITSAAAVGKSRPAAGCKDLQCMVCDRFYDVTRMVNIGDKNYAMWRDRHCHKAVRLVERAADTKGEFARNNLSNLRKHSKADWKRLICSVRINFEDDAPCQWDNQASVFDAGEATKGEAHTEALAATSLHSETRFAMFTKRQFKAYMVNQEMYSQAEAEALWRSAVGNADIYKEVGEDSTTTVAVRLPKVVSGRFGMDRKRRIVDISEVSDTVERVKKLSGTPDLTNELSSEMGIVLNMPGRHFVVPDPDEKEKSGRGKDDGDAIGKVGSGSVSGFISPAKRGMSWEDMTVAGGSGTGSGDEAGSEAGVGKVNLVLARSQTMSSARHLITTLYERKSAPFNLLKDLIKAKLGEDHRDVKELGLKEKCEEFEKLMTGLQDGVDKAKHWTQGSVKGKVDDMAKSMDKVESLSESFVSALVALKRVRRSEVVEKGLGARKLGAHLRSVLGKGALPLQGFPKPMCTWFGAEVLGITFDMQAFDADKAKTSLENDVDSFDATLSTMMVFKAASTHPFKKAMDSLEKLCEASAMKMLPKLSDHLGKNPGVFHNLTKLQLKDDNLKGFTDLSWWTGAFEKDKVSMPVVGSPDTKLAACKPWLLATKKWGVRWGSSALPYVGLSAAIRVTEGCVAVIAWPLRSVVCSGAAVGDTESFLGGMSQADMSRWAASHATYFVLNKGDVAFVPFGMQTVVVSLDEMAAAVWVPWMSSSLWQAQCKDLKDLVRGILVEFFDAEPPSSLFKKEGAHITAFLS